MSIRSGATHDHSSQGALLTPGAKAQAASLTQPPSRVAKMLSRKISSRFARARSLFAQRAHEMHRMPSSAS